MINLPHDWMRVQHKSCFVHEPHCCAQGERGEGGENLRPPRQKKRNRQDKSEPRKKLPVANKWNVFFSKKWVLVFMRLPEPPGISSNSPPPLKNSCALQCKYSYIFCRKGLVFTWSAESSGMGQCWTAAAIWAGSMLDSRLGSWKIKSKI